MPRDVDIEVVYVPPATDVPQEVLTEALAAFREIDVQPVEFDQASAGAAGFTAYRGIIEACLNAGISEPSHLEADEAAQISRQTWGAFFY